MRGGADGTTRCWSVVVVRVWTITTGGWAGGSVVGCWLMMTLPLLLLAAAAAAAATTTTEDDGVVDEMMADMVVVVVDGLGRAGRPMVVPLDWKWKKGNVSNRRSSCSEEFLSLPLSRSSALQQTLKTTFILWEEHRPPMRRCKSSLDEVAVINNHQRRTIITRVLKQTKDGRRRRKMLTDEIVVLSGSEFQSAGLGRERAERDGEVHELVRLVADGDDPRIGVGNAARVVLFLGHVVDDVLFSVVLVSSRSVDGANNVDLVVLERNVIFVDVNDVVRIVYPESVGKKKKEREKHFNFSAGISLNIFQREKQEGGHQRTQSTTAAHTSTRERTTIIIG